MITEILISIVFGQLLIVLYKLGKIEERVKYINHTITQLEENLRRVMDKLFSNN